MGIKDWFKKKETEPEVKQQQSTIQLPEMDKDALFEETFDALNSEEVELELEEVVETVPEYDSGDVDVEALMEDEMGSNYDLNTVEETNVEEHLENVEIIGDLPEEVEL
tara:strand:+ start:153 stop:479 length:327 start_codon:yes stop_codon:yes gene_type:complete